MTSSRLSAFALTVILAATGFGCDDEDVAAAVDARPVGGPGGAGAGTGGTAGQGGSGGGADAFVDRSPDRSPDGVADGQVTDTRSDTAAPDLPPANTAAPDASTPDAQAQDAAATLPDAGPSPDLGNVVVAQECAQVNCPALLDVTNQCIIGESTCTEQIVSMTDEMEIKNICHLNGIKKISTTTYPTPTTYLTSMTVLKVDGSPCFILEVSGSDSPIESWIFRSPAGAELARAELTPPNLLLTCQATVYDITNAGCPGTEGIGLCPAGTCN